MQSFVRRITRQFYLELEQFTHYFEYVNTLQFQEQPDYSWLRRTFKDLFESRGLVNNRVLDWAQRHKY